MGWADPRLIAANVFISALAIWSMSKVVFSAIAPGRFPPEENPTYIYGLNE
jgi:cellulose synthase (UDP-forming)